MTLWICDYINVVQEFTKGVFNILALYVFHLKTRTIAFCMKIAVVFLVPWKVSQRWKIFLFSAMKFVSVLLCASPYIWTHWLVQSTKFSMCWFFSFACFSFSVPGRSAFLRCDFEKSAPLNNACFSERMLSIPWIKHLYFSVFTSIEMMFFLRNTLHNGRLLKRTMFTCFVSQHFMRTVSSSGDYNTVYMIRIERAKELQ